MRIHISHLFTFMLLAMLIGSVTAKGDTFTNVHVSENATIAGAAFFGTVQAGAVSAPTGSTHGMAVNVTQGTEMVWGSLLVPGHYEDNWVTVEDWGWDSMVGHWEPHYEWQVVSWNYYPPIYDESGIILMYEWYDYYYDWVYTGDVWVETGGMVVTGTHSENQPIWVADSYQPYEEERYGTPVIHQKATRSDANWVWEIPTEGGGIRSVMRLWDGGLSLPRLDGSTAMSLTPGALIYTLGNTTTQVGADVTTYVTQVTEGGTAAESKAEVRPELVRLTRTETTSGTTTTGMTQIAAKSASFGGVVTVEGSLKVKGVLRVAAGGDLSMGEFATSPAGIDPP